MKDIRYSKIKDLEDRGGGFVVEKKIGSFLTGDLYRGTAYFNNGDHADIKVIYLPYGDTRILGSAFDTEECRKDFENLTTYLESLKRTEDYKATLFIRRLLSTLLRITQMLIIGRFIFDLATIRPLVTVYSIMYFIMEGMLFILVKKIKELIGSIY